MRRVDSIARAAPTSGQRIRMAAQFLRSVRADDLSQLTLGIELYELIAKDLSLHWDGWCSEAGRATGDWLELSYEGYAAANRIRTAAERACEERALDDADALIVLHQRLATSLGLLSHIGALPALQARPRLASNA